MSFASKYNHSGIIFDINIKDFPYMSLYKLDDLEKTYPVKGMYIKTDGKRGPFPIFICDGFLVGMPEHLTDSVKDILNDQEGINDIKAGKVAFKIRPYTDKDGHDRRSIDWVDI